MKKFRLLSIILSIVLMLSFTGCEILGDNEESDGESKKSYDISNSFFSVATYEPHTYTNVNVKDGGTTYEFVLTISSSCSVSLYEYKAVVKMYSESNRLLDKQTIDRTKTISANTKFSFNVTVPSTVQSSVSSVDVVFSGKSYDKPVATTQTHKVSFIYNNGTATSTVVVENGKTVSTPKDPQKTNYIFSGWYTESLFINKYDFSKSVDRDLTLYAKYEVDAVTITNKISTDTIKGVVKIYNKSYNTFLGIETSSSTSQGSGFCFYTQSGYYYILTNCHVAKKDSSYDKQKFTIEDYQGKTYEGYLYQNTNKTYSAISPSYDLACLWFKPSSTNVKKLSFANGNPSFYEDVISLGAPRSQSNAITYGNVSDYRKITLSNTSVSRSNVTFDVICHDAYINNGSSGGPLLNTNLKVVGVNYAGDSSGFGYAIPIEKVQEFLRKYFYN